MDHSIYTDGVVVGQVDLERTETTKKFHINQRHDDASVLGVTSGQVTVNTLNNTLIDISAFTGYTPNGEYIESTTAETARQLADYTNGTINYVLGMYTETNTLLKPHETNGNSYPTAAARSYRIVIVTEAQYNALPTTDDNLNNNAKDRALIIGKVTARGVGVALTSSDITNATTFGSAISAVKTSNIAGVQIYNVDRTTMAGTGSLSYAAGGQQLTWKSPDPLDTYGAAVTVSTSGIYEVKSGTFLKSLYVIVTSPSLPGTNQTDTVTITNIYSQSVSRYTAEDIHHRSLIGSGIPTTLNPHGLTIEDLGVSSGIVEIHQDLFHSNGVLRTSATNLFTLSVNTTAPHSLNVVAPISGDAFYLNGREHNLLASSNIQFGGALPNYQSLYDIYVLEGSNKIATLEKKERARYATTPPPAMATYVQLRNIDRRFARTSDATVKIKFDTAVDKIYFDSTGTGGSYGIGVAVPGAGNSTIRVFDSTEEYYIDLHVNSTIAAQANMEEIVTVYKIISSTETYHVFMEPRIHAGTIMYSGTASAFLGNGFALGYNSPNNPYNYRRIFGITGPDDIRDDGGTFEDTVDTIPETSPALYTNKWVGIGLGARYPLSQLHLSNLNGSVAFTIVSKPASLAYINFRDGRNGDYWAVGKGTDNRFYVWDTVRNTNVIRITSNGNMNLMESIGSGAAANIAIGTTVHSASALTLQDNTNPTSDYQRVVQIFTPNVANTHHQLFQFGKADSAGNCAEMMYYHAADGSTANSFILGVQGSQIVNITKRGTLCLCSIVDNTAYGVFGSNSGTGYGVIAEAQSTVRSSLRIVPQSSAPNGQRGDICILNNSGREIIYNGVEWCGTVGCPFSHLSILDSVTVNNSSNIFSQSYTIPAATLNTGSTIRIKASCIITAAAGSPTWFWISINVGGNVYVVAITPQKAAAVNDMADLTACVVIKTMTAISVGGIGAIGGPPAGVPLISPAGSIAPYSNTFNPTLNLNVNTVIINVWMGSAPAGAGVTGRLDTLTVDISES